MNAAIDFDTPEASSYDVDLCWTRAKIAQWGRRSRAIGTGYPTMAATEKARIGRGGRFTGPALPPDLEEIDGIITRAPARHRRILTEAYTKWGTGSNHAARLGFSLRDYWRRKTEAEEYVMRHLQLLAL